MHGGFMKALGLLKSQGWPQEQDPKLPETAYYAIRKHLKKLMQQNEKTKFIVTGHNLGGALALLFPAILGLHGDSFLLNRLEGVYTFGQPRVGDEEFGKYMTKLINKYTFRYVRFVYSYDVVPRLPCDNDTFMFKHFGACIYFNSLYKGKISREAELMDYRPSQRSAMDMDVPMRQKGKRRTNKKTACRESSSQFVYDSDDDFVDPPPPRSVV
ncbi:triacylglycerol lipase OBL1-like [Salvia splendens]|uniref:triacylglycerol lipase OBL1-like n=1 Tax=Salvia splendens TaxID=180675 RepID=UPI001C262A87|nr:triacylglycerol lipase OBL1-like [Salvia splendens]